MVQILSLPLFITASISFILSLFFLALYFRLRTHHQEPVKYFGIFALAAFVSGIFFGAFAVLLNSGNNLDALNIANRITIIASMFTIVLNVHFYNAFFDYKAPTLLKWCYFICSIFSMLAAVPSQLFLEKEFLVTSQFYTGLSYGPLFELWGIWVLVFALYCVFILVRVYMQQRDKNEGKKTNVVKLLLFVNIVWLITGVSDTLTGVQAIDLPPLTWIGSFLVTSSIAWVLVLHIDQLYLEKRELNDQLKFDHLTQAYSRSYLEIHLAETLSLMKRKEIAVLSICVFDVDNFKGINDQYGHSSGDELLKQITQIIKNNIRHLDCVARLGGDEFVILLAEKQPTNNADIMIERIRKNIAEHLFVSGTHQFYASCSFGIVSITAEHLCVSDVANTILSSADEALYSAKHKGKNTIGFATLPLEST